MADFTNIVECSLQDDNSIYPRTCNVQSEEYDRESPGSEDMEMERPEVQSSQVVGKGWEITRMKYRGKGNTPSEDWVKGTLGYWLWMKLRKDDIKSTELESENTASEGRGRENNYNFRGLLGFKRGRNGKRTHRFWGSSDPRVALASRIFVRRQQPLGDNMASCKGNNNQFAKMARFSKFPFG